MSKGDDLWSYSCRWKVVSLVYMVTLQHRVQTPEETYLYEPGSQQWWKALPWKGHDDGQLYRRTLFK
ncbi:hypothetical protein RUM43_004966 [Polyplax serrata]|uniref:Uncharacterized protein n=1 Tax=Polyplax serrata TaxID=468196 RepID=A0AAN8SCD2_POLSC